jgi:hypothetical protein
MVQEISSFGQLVDGRPCASRSLIGDPSVADFITLPIFFNNVVGQSCPIDEAMMSQINLRLTSTFQVWTLTPSLTIKPVTASKGQYLLTYQSPGWSHRVDLLLAEVKFMNSPVVVQIEPNEV